MHGVVPSERAAFHQGESSFLEEQVQTSHFSNADSPAVRPAKAALDTVGFDLN